MIVQDFLKSRESEKGLQDRIELVSIWGRTPEKTGALKEAYGIGKTFDDYDQFLNSGIDTVYVALPNHLHYAYARRALEAGKNVILEKPFTLHYDSSEELFRIAEENGASIYEAITTQYSPDYQKIGDLIEHLGEIRMLQGNYSQYSSRYERFQKGEMPDAFNPEKGGGALGDLNIYNIHMAAGLFGRPEKVAYFPNLQRGADTSGVLLLYYPDFKAVLTAAKDSSSESFFIIQGEDGEIIMRTAPNVAGIFEIKTRDGIHEAYDLTGERERLAPEFDTFSRGAMRNYDLYQKMKKRTLDAMWILEEARKSADLLPADETDPFVS